jgi:hypothetical protein
MCRYAVPPGCVRAKPVSFPKLGPLIGVTDAILDADETAPVKQRLLSCCKSVRSVSPVD